MIVSVVLVFLNFNKGWEGGPRLDAANYNIGIAGSFQLFIGSSDIVQGVTGAYSVAGLIPGGFFGVRNPARPAKQASPGPKGPAGSLLRRPRIMDSCGR